MDINFDKIGEGVKRFAMENAGEFLGAIAMAAVYSFCKNHGINMRPPTVFDAYCDSSSGQRNVQLAMLPRNSIEAAIASIAQTAINSHSDYDKREAAQKITDILGGSKVDDDTKTFAVSSLSSIANSTTSGFTQRDISDHICRLAR